MNHTKCEDCKLRDGDCGHHFKMSGKGKTNYNIPSLTACDRYGDCMFFQREERPQGDLISREALKNVICDIDFDFGDYYDHTQEIRECVCGKIDNAPTVVINTNDIEYKAYCKGLEDGRKIVKRPHGEWLKSGKGKTIFFCSECGREIDTKPFTRPDNFPFCYCGADMRGEEE